MQRFSAAFFAVVLVVGCAERDSEQDAELSLSGSPASGGEFTSTSASAEQTALAGAGVDGRNSGAEVTPVAADGDWPWWRGPNRNGIAAGGQTPPVSWSETENVLWKAPVPGRGHSSPTIVGNQIFLATADERQQIQSVVAFDRATGKELWKTDLTRGGFPSRIHHKNTHATCTVASDAQQLYVAFYNRDRIHAAALDLDGHKVWERDLGPFEPRQYQYGYAPSPTLYGDLVIFAADYEGGGYLTALKAESGEPVWNTPRPMRLSYSSPIVALLNGRHQLLISGCDHVTAYDPSTGKQLWATPATTMATCGTMVWDGNLVFASGGYPKAETVCIQCDGSGRVVWKNKQQCYEQSMLVHEGYLYAVTDNGIAYCWKADDGREMWKTRLRGPVSASPILAAGNIYQTVENGTTFVFKANPLQYEAVAQNQLGTEGFATPAICSGRIYLRVAHGQGGERREMLYCIGGSL